MQLSILSTWLLAVGNVVLAAPAAVVDADDGYLETIVLKRDAVLTPRDLELAKRHGVDVTQMYKHSIHKRADGDDVTIWVDNGYVGPDSPVNSTEEDSSSLDERAITVTHYHSSGSSFSNSCSVSTFYSKTTQYSPYTFGLDEMVRWGRRNTGYFYLNPECCPNNKQLNLVVAGSNSGANGRFSAGQHPGDVSLPARVGVYDIADLAEDTKKKFEKKYDGWRAAGNGGMRCDPESPFFNRRPYVQWTIERSQIWI